MSDSLLPSGEISHSHGQSRDASSFAWEFHRAAESLRLLDAQNVPAIRRALRSLDRATNDLVQYYERPYNHEQCPVVFPDYFSVDLENIMDRLYFPDEQAQQLLANILDRLSSLVSVTPGHVDNILSLLLSTTPCSELQSIWLYFLVHCGHGAWKVLTQGAHVSGDDAASTNSTSSFNAAPWLERLFLLLLRAQNEYADTPWSVQGTKSKEYSAVIMWRSTIGLVLDVVRHLYRSQAASVVPSNADASGNLPSGNNQPVTIFSWMQASLVRHMQVTGMGSNQSPALLHNLCSQCGKLMALVGKFALQMTEYAMDALDGALVVMEHYEQDAETGSAGGELPQWAIHDAMHHIESALYVLQVTHEWKILSNFADMAEDMWKQCSRAFIGKDEDGVVARMVLDLAKQHLLVAIDCPSKGEDDAMTLDEPTFILTLFRATESCPAELLESAVIWKVLASELQESKNQQIKLAVQAILFSLSTGSELGRASDDAQALLAKRFMRLLNECPHSKDDSTDDWEAFFLQHFTSDP